MLPTFVVIGARKSGTTSLWRYLDAHPQVFVPQDEKEPKYFVAERGWARGRAWYESLFADAGDALARGECSTDYTAFPHYGGVPERMAALLPDVRLVYVLRDPVERMRSAYAYSLWLGTETRPIADALLTDARYANESRYALQIEQYLACFRQDQLLLVTAEELRERRQATLSKVFAFIGVDPQWTPANVTTEFNTVEGRRAPRRWWRSAGDVLIRTGLGERLPLRVRPALERLDATGLARRPIADAELVVDDDLRARFIRFFRADLVTLTQWMGPEFDAWGMLG